MTIDPVCGAAIDATAAAVQAEYKQHTYAFCSDACRDRFEAHPEQFSAETGPPVCAVCGAAIGPDDVVCPQCGSSLAAG